MLIRSQDKLKLIPLADGYIGVFGKGIYLVPYSEARSIELGMYSDEDNALKVLDMIEKEYSKYMTVMGGPALVKGGMDVQPAIYNIPKVFHMPQEEEI